MAFSLNLLEKKNELKAGAINAFIPVSVIVNLLLRKLFPAKPLNIFYLFYFICHTSIITKNKGKERKKKWRGDLTKNLGAYERLGLLELRVRAAKHSIKEKIQKHRSSVKSTFNYTSTRDVHATRYNQKKKLF